MANITRALHPVEQWVQHITKTTRSDSGHTAACGLRPGTAAIPRDAAERTQHAGH